MPHTLRPPGTLTSGEAFVWLDRRMDNPAKAAVSKVAGDRENHGRVHSVLAPAHLLKPHNGATAQAAIKLRGITGQPFWQQEAYDHWVRDHADFLKMRAYIENNPVKAGLVERAEDFPWSSACVAMSPVAARTSAYATSN